MKKPFYADLGDFQEDERIRMIGKTCVDNQKTIAFVTDDDPGKADRYIEKLMRWFPGQIDVIARGAGPVNGTVFVMVAPLRKEASS